MKMSEILILGRKYRGFVGRWIHHWWMWRILRHDKKTAKRCGGKHRVTLCGLGTPHGAESEIDLIAEVAALLDGRSHHTSRMPALDPRSHITRRVHVKSAVSEHAREMVDDGQRTVSTLPGDHDGQIGELRPDARGHEASSSSEGGAPGPLV